MITYTYVVDAEDLPARSSTAVHEKWGNVVNGIWSRGAASSQAIVTPI